MSSLLEDPVWRYQAFQEVSTSRRTASAVRYNLESKERIDGKH